MKSGELASALGLSRDAVNTWMRRPEFAKFFSPEALAQVGTPQRQFNESDVLVLNTIRWLRYEQNVTEWDEITRRLESGERFTEFPQSSLTADPRTIPYQQAEVSVKAAATMAERDYLASQVSELQSRVASLEKQLETERTMHKQDLERLLREIAALNREMGRLERDKGQGQ